MVQNLKIAESKIFTFSKLFVGHFPRKSVRNEVSALYRDTVDENKKKEKGSIVIGKGSDQ